MPFAALIARTVTPKRIAIDDSVSPLRTLSPRPAAGLDDAPGDALAGGWLGATDPDGAGSAEAEGTAVGVGAAVGAIVGSGVAAALAAAEALGTPAPAANEAGGSPDSVPGVT